MIEFLPDASYKAIKLSPATARLDPRDVSIFMERMGYSNQRATLAPRQGAILFRTEIARAIIRADRALVFACRLVQDRRQLTLSKMLSIPGRTGILECLIMPNINRCCQKLELAGRLALPESLFSVSQTVQHASRRSSGNCRL